MKTKIVAEIGLAHEGRTDYAKRLIDQCAEAGVDAVKFQVYRTRELINPKRHPEMYERFSKKELTYQTLALLKGYATGCGLEWFATPHTLNALDFLLDLGVETIKVGSGDRGEILQAADRAGKEIYLSFGLGKKPRDYTCTRARCTYFHCITEYPTPRKHANLGYLKTLKHHFLHVGYSDHTKGADAILAAVAIGVDVVEKHVKLPKSTGQDTTCALFGHELKEMVKKVRRMEEMIGSEERIYTEAERRNESWALKKEDGLR